MKKTLVLVVLATVILPVFAFDFGLYSTDENSWSTKNGISLYENSDGEDGDDNFEDPFGPGGGDPPGNGGFGEGGKDELPVEEGIFILTALAGGYTLLKNKNRINNN
jgi:hypothetical protein